MANKEWSTLVDFIANSKSTPNVNDVVDFLGYSAKGIGGASWIFKGITGQTPSQSPAQLGDALLNDGDGNQWELVTKGLEINAASLGFIPSLTTNSTDAINAALNVLRNSANRVNPLPGTGQITPLNLVMPAGVYLCEESINATMLQFQGWGISAKGCVIYSKATGEVAFDLLGSRFGDIEGLMVLGDDVSRPKIGIQYGRTSLGVAADNLSFSQCKTGGYFTLAGVYNFASETEQHDHPAYYNYDSGIDSFGLLIDGRNMFDCQSNFVTQSIPVNTPQSCIQHLFNCADIRKPNGGPPIGIARTDQLEFNTGYAVSVDDYAVRLYEDDNGMRDLIFDIHSESGTAGLLGVFDFRKATGALSTTSEYYGFKYKEHSLQVTNRVINIDAGITALKIKGKMGIDNILQSVGAPPNGLVVPGGILSFTGFISCPATILKGNFTMSGALLVDTIVDGSYGIGNYSVIDDSGTSIQKGNANFRGNRSNTFTGANLINGEDTTIRDSSLEMHPLAVQPPLSGVMISVDDGTNWSGVNPSGLPRPVFHNGTSWMLMV